MKLLEIIKKSFLAGIMISIGGYIYLASDNKYLGSFLFSLGLFFIIVCSLNLYTGKVGYMIQKKSYLETVIILVGNVIACIIMGVLLRLVSSDLLIYKTELLVKAKLELDYLTVFLKGFFCGFMIYIAVEGARRINEFSGKIFVVSASIMVFILAGFEHSIADAFYFAIANVFSFKVLLFLFIVIIGNGVGSIFFHHILKPLERDDEV